MNNYITVYDGMVLNLGHQGENNATIFRFPIKDWRIKYGDGEFSLYNKRTYDPDGYLCEVTSDEMYVYWSVSNTDTQYKGKGRCQLVYTVDGVIAKSDTYNTMVEEALTVTETPPAPWTTWVDDIKNQVKEIKLGDLNLQKLKDYLYYIEFTDWDYNKAIEHFKNSYPSSGYCSSVRNGSFYGRNFDWFYDESASFVVRSKATKGRHASVGIAGGSPLLTKTLVEAGEWDDYFEMIPFITVDGINDAGVVCNTNVVPTGDKGHTTGTNPSAEKTLCTLMIVRFVLDYADSAADAINKIQNINWYALSGEGAIKAQELHCMIAESASTEVVEFVDNSVKVFSDVDDEYQSIPNNVPIMTNFYYDGWNGNIVTGFDVEGGISPEDTTLTAHAEGTERYEIVRERYDTLDSRDSMLQMMKGIWYTHAFDRESDPFWYSELVGYTDKYGDLTIYDNATEFSGIKEDVIDMFENRTRDGKTWQTVHTSIIDIDNKTLTVYAQESDDGFGFTVYQPGERILGIVDAGDIYYDYDVDYPQNTIGKEIRKSTDDIIDIELDVYYLLHKTINAGEVLYGDSEEYENGSVGIQIQNIKSHENDVDGTLLNHGSRISTLEGKSITSGDVSYSDSIEYESGTIGAKVKYIDNKYKVESENVTVSEDSWERIPDESVEPYIFSSVVQVQHTIGENTKVELINNNAVMFAQYGFAIADADEEYITFYSVKKPSNDVSLRVEFMG